LVSGVCFSVLFFFFFFFFNRNSKFMFMLQMNIRMLHRAIYSSTPSGIE